MLRVFVVSGGTGKTAERVTRAALLQFENISVDLVRRESTRKVAQVRAIMREAQSDDSLVFYTLVNEELRRAMVTEAHKHDVDAVDIMGPVLDRLAARLKLIPLGKPGLLAQTEEARTREIEAVEFAFRHDDGQNVGELKRAEVVLVGVSRSMKTPTTLYLGYRGWFAANIPLIAEIDPPRELLSVTGKRVYYLHMGADRLRQLRLSRCERDAIPAEPYASTKQIRKELQYARRWASKQGWRTIDVTGKSVEEVSREIILLATGGIAKSKPRS